jgi:hypothetical protein
VDHGAAAPAAPPKGRATWSASRGAFLRWRPRATGAR